MRNQIRNIARSRGLENAILVSILLFLFNLIFPLHDSVILAIINELLVFLTVLFLYHYVHQFLNSKVDSPLTLVLNAGILAALIFFIVSIANSILGSQDNSKGIGFFNSLFSVLLTFVFIGSIVYIFSTFRELFFLRQKKDLSTFFHTMLIFFALSFFSNMLVLFNPSLDYPKDAFYVVTIVLICLNSTRVSWIAFLTKKQKYYLLMISVILSALFGINFATFIDNSIMRQIVYTFSPGLHTFMSLVMIYGTINFAVIFFTTLFHLPTAEAFDRKAQEVNFLQYFSKLIMESVDFKDLADTVTEIATKVCNANAAWIAWKEGNEFKSLANKNIGF